MALAHAEAGQLEDAIAECEGGLEINPNCSLILGELGNYFALLGRSQEAIEMCRLTLRLNPSDPSNFWHHFTIATAHFAAADYEAALRECQKIARARAHLQSAVIWAAAAAGLSRPEEARAAVAHCLAQRPDLCIGKVVPDVLPRFARDEDHQRLLELLRQAGLPG
jgi:tetratricopeptide (TPR) repeat protein